MGYLAIVVLAAGFFFLRRLLKTVLRFRRLNQRLHNRPPRYSHRKARHLLETRPETRRRLDSLSGKAYVTDGDGIRVSGREVRLSGLDAPEWDQVAKHRDGYWFPHGKRVKSALIREVGGRHVQVSVESYDKFGRAVGSVTCDGTDVGDWLVREGHAWALYGDRYKHAEREARRAKRGMWSNEVNIDPRKWRHRKRSRD